jgi:hypothetical protein
MQILEFDSFIKVAMEIKTRETRIKYQELINQPETPETISAIAKLRKDYNHFMNDCYRQLKADNKNFKQTQE